MISSLHSFDLAFQPRGERPGAFHTPPCLPPLTMTSGTGVQRGTCEMQTVEVDGSSSESAEMDAREYANGTEVKMTSGLCSRKGGGRRSTRMSSMSSVISERGKAELTFHHLNSTPDGSRNLGSDLVSQVFTRRIEFLDTSDNDTSEVDGLKEGFEHGAL